MFLISELSYKNLVEIPLYFLILSYQLNQYSQHGNKIQHILII